MYVIYETATGKLISQTTDAGLVANPLNPAYTVKQVVDPPNGYVWSEGTLDFVAAPSPRVIPKYQFIERFTLTEKKELFGFQYGTTYNATQQKNLASIMRYLDFVDYINLDSTDIQTGVNYFVTVGILTSGRAATVLA